MWTCPECKKEIEDDCDLCYYCGYSISSLQANKKNAKQQKKTSEPNAQEVNFVACKNTTDEDILSSIAVVILVIGILSSIVLFEMSGNDDVKWATIGAAIAVLISAIGAWALLKVISNISTSLKKIAWGSKSNNCI